MLTSIDVKFIFDTSCLSGSLGNKELFSSGNILQIEDAMFLFLPRETSEMFRHFVFTFTTTQPHPQVSVAVA